MANSPFYSLLHAYALGSLNKEDIKELKSYLKSGSEFEWSELGEYQNLSAMLPAILNLENPPAHLKDKVARKLYRLRDERRKTIIDARRLTKIIPPVEEAPVEEALVEESAFAPNEDAISADEQGSENTIDPIGNISQQDLENIMAQSNKLQSEVQEAAPEDIPVIEEEFNIPNENLAEIKDAATESQIVESAVQEPEVPEPKIPEPEPVSEFVNGETLMTEENNSEETVEPAEETAAAAITGEAPPAVPPVTNPILERLSEASEEKPRGRKGLWGMVIFLLLLIIAMGAAVYFIYNQLNRNKRELEDLRRQVNTISMRSDAGADILSIATSKDFKIADLKPVKQNEDAYGKVFMSYDLKIAYFEYANIPELTADKTYHLWARISEETIPLGEFTPKGSVNLEPLPKLPVIDKDKGVSFLLTLEKAGKAEVPSSNIYLTGEVK